MWTSLDSKMLASLSETVNAGIAMFDVINAHDVQLLSTNSIFREMYDLTTKDHGTMLRKDLIDIFANASIDCAQQRVPVDFEHALNGNTVWFRARLIPFASEKKEESARVFVSVVDITAKRHLEQNLQVTNNRLYNIIDSSLEGIVIVDVDQRIKSLNTAASSIFGYTNEEIVGQSLDVLIPERFRAKHPKYVREFQDSNETSLPPDCRMEIRGLRKDGTEFLAEIAISKVSTRGVLEFSASVRDISEHVKRIDELYLRSSTDPLTGLYNHHHLVEEANREFIRAKRFDHPLSLIFIDLDNFKAINDELGHLIGDQVLLRTATLCRQEARQTDVIARWGGEAFLLLLPETDTDGAVSLAKRILNQLHGLHLRISPLGANQITASIGISTWHGEGDGFQTMVNRANQAVQKAKISGKDKIIRAIVRPSEQRSRGH